MKNIYDMAYNNICLDVVYVCLQAVFVGHNHGLDWCCPHKTKNKLWLCFARHSGYGGYGNWPRGARIIQITHQPFSLKSWIRMEDGQLDSEIILTQQIFLSHTLHMYVFFTRKMTLDVLICRIKNVFCCSHIHQSQNLFMYFKIFIFLQKLLYITPSIS